VHRTCFVIFAFIAVYAWSGLAVQAQPRLFGCGRSGFESYSEAERRPAIRYLDAARVLADKSVKLYVDGKISELYAGLWPSMKETHSEIEFRAKLEERERYTGNVLDYEYRDQGFTYSDPTKDIDLHEGWATTIYTGHAAHWDGTVIIEVSTMQRDATPVLTGIELLRADPNTDLDKIFPKATGERCPWVRGPLNIKAIN